VKWASITGDFGRLELANYAAAKGRSRATRWPVYSPQETTATLCLSAKGDARIWVNGELVRTFGDRLAVEPFASGARAVRLVRS
jgi:hypothetical protein